MADPDRDDATPEPSADPGRDDATPEPSADPRPRAPSVSEGSTGTPPAPSPRDDALPQPSADPPPGAPSVSEAGTDTRPAPPPRSDAPHHDPTPSPDAPAPASEPRRSSWLARGLIALGLFVLAVILGPWILSRTVLTQSVRSSMQAAAGESADVAEVSLSWREGFALRKAVIADPPPGVPELLLGELAFETDALSWLLGFYGGSEVAGRMTVRSARIVLDVPVERLTPGDEEAPDETPEETPPEGEEEAEPIELPCPIRPSFLMEDVDVVLRWAPGDQPARRLTLRGVRVEGGGRVATDLALDLDEQVKTSVDEVYVEVEGAEDAPARTLFAIEGMAFTAEALRAPSPHEASPLTLTSVFRLDVPKARFGDVPLHDLSGTTRFDAGQAELGFRGSFPQGTLETTGSFDMRDPAGWPVRFSFALEEVDLTGDLARYAPYLVPLLRATDRRGMPPLSLRLEGAATIAFDEERAFDLDETLATAQGAGSFEVAAGSLSGSLLIDGYTQALTGLGVYSLVDGLIPPRFEIDSAKGSFTVQAGEVRLPRIELRSDALDLLFTGRVRFDGTFDFRIRSLLPDDAAGVKALVKALDDAGGVVLKGSLIDQTVTAELPDVDRLIAAARERGVLDLLSGSGDVGRQVQETLGGLRGPR